MKWTVITVWECQLKKCIDEETLEKLYNKITSKKKYQNMNFIYYSLFIYSLTLSLKTINKDQIIDINLYAYMYHIIYNY